MKVGDYVVLEGSGDVRVVAFLKTDSRGIWIRFASDPKDYWHNAAYWKVVEPQPQKKKPSVE